MNRGIINFAHENNIPVIILGGGIPFESVKYRENLLKINPKGGKLSRLAGYLYQIIKNPKWIMNFTYIITQFFEYFYFFYPKMVYENQGLYRIYPFHNYIRWEEKEVISTIKNNLNWQKNPISDPTWRTDCDIASLKLYAYKKIFRFNDKVDGLSHLIRDDQISREKAIKRLTEENIPDKAIIPIFTRLGLKYSDFNLCIKKCAKNSDY